MFTSTESSAKRDVLSNERNETELCTAAAQISRRRRCEKLSIIGGEHQRDFGINRHQSYLSYYLAFCKRCRKKVVEEID